MTISAKDVQALRQATGAGMMDCKRALEATDGNVEDAMKWLRERGLASAAKRTDREANQGAVSICKMDGSAAIAELKCETDFVAKSESFVNMAGDIAEAVALSGEAAAEGLKSQVDDLSVSLKENIQIGRIVRFGAVPGHVIGDYLHIQNERGVNAVLVELEGGTDELAHDIALHIAFARPEYLTRDEVPEDAVADARSEFENLSRNEGKPEAALPKIVEGRLGGWYRERCLVEQAYVKDEKTTVGSVTGNARILRFAQVVVGT